MLRYSIKGAIAAAAGLLLSVLAAPRLAHASVIYNLQPGITTGSTGQPAPLLSFQLVEFNTFVPGPFSRDCSYGSCSPQTGSFSDFQLTAYSNGTSFGVLDTVFDPVFEHTVGNFLGSSGTLTWDTSTFSINLVFGGGTWSSVFNADLPGYQHDCFGGNCTASGAEVLVAEPASGALLAAGVFGLAVVVRRRRLGWENAA